MDASTQLLLKRIDELAGRADLPDVYDAMLRSVLYALEFEIRTLRERVQKIEMEYVVDEVRIDAELKALHERLRKLE